jgi:hypothetical protein
VLRSFLKILAGFSLAFILGLVGYYFYPNNLARRPPVLDGLRAQVLKQTHLEAEFFFDTTLLGEPILEGKVNILFAHVPANADKAAIEKITRGLVKQSLPNVQEVNVGFGDNLRTRPLKTEKPGPVYE